MYGISLGSLTLRGSTGKRFFPPEFCQSMNDLDLNVVIPVLPRFFPFILFLSFSFIFLHCSFDMPLGMYSIVTRASLLIPDADDTCDPENEDVTENPAAGDAVRAMTEATATAMVGDFMMI